MRWYHKADLAKGERIKMVDVVSEYPNANLRGRYPHGHPEIFLEGDPAIPTVKDWNGVIKGTVLPPRDLFVPVLPYKCSGKLMFPLCRTCAETESQEQCRHEDPALRQLTGTWCAPELQLAVLEKGYKLVKVHEVYQYPGTTQYNPETGEDGLFSGYIRCVLAMKMQASGWPVECDTEDKEEYIADILKYDGITIDPKKVEKNPGLRTIGKLEGNSFWGKLAQRTLLPTTEIVYNYADMTKIVADPSKKVSFVTSE